MVKNIFVLFSLVLVSSAFAAEQKVTPKIEAAALFKNGFIIVRQSIDIPAAGSYRWENVPGMIHGTFFIDTDLNIAVRTAHRKVPAEKSVRLVLQTSEGQKTYTGKLIASAAKTTPETKQETGPAENKPAKSPSLWSLELEDQRVIDFSPNDIVSLNALNVDTEQTVPKSIMTFNVTEKNGKAAGTIKMLYLVKGNATWAPSYRINLRDGKTATVEQTAVIRNEWMQLTDTEISLVSGFPHIGMENTHSLLNPLQKIEMFFRQLAGVDTNSPVGSPISQMISNSVMTNNKDESRFDTVEVAAGEGPDVFYNSIGKQTLDVGETLYTATGAADAEYKRIMLCDISKWLLTNYQNRNNQHYKPAEMPPVFDAVTFDNPLPFPMTTAPVLISEQNRFLGQDKTGWVSPKQQAQVMITKVLSMAVEYEEKVAEIKDPRTRTVQDRLEDRQYQTYAVTDTIELTNKRNEPVTLHLDAVLIHSRDEANLKCSIPPKKQSAMAEWTYRSYLNAGVSDEATLNTCTEFRWEIPLKAGEKKSITVSAERWRWLSTQIRKEKPVMSVK
ncbi:MAG: DUF4139 domain-containing protein [Planctomycetaceae bacterium]|jgi:hypothetical protein|nr:DUF4139 domain-containing protein [Planctomycetaceae bacterium]